MNNRSRAAVVKELAGILEQAAHSAAALKQALADERAALSGRDQDSLAQAVAVKQAEVQNLDRLEQRRISACRAVDESADMAQVLAWCDAGPDLADHWSRLLELGTECDSLNLGNGAIIRLRQQQVAEGLMILRGAPAETTTYGPTGTTACAPGGRALTEA